jgi:transketolase
MGLPVVYVFTHDSVHVGEDGPTHQPIEHLASLRAIPNLHVFRPADGVECAAAWAHAIARTDGPTAIVLTRQKVALIARPDGFDEAAILGGATVVLECESPAATLVATGSEVSLALDAARLLARDERPVRVVSMPCVEAFDGLEEMARERLVPSDGRVAVIEAGSPQGWHRLTGRRGLVIGLDRFGASAPGAEVAQRLGFSAERVAERITEWLAGEG